MLRSLFGGRNDLTRGKRIVFLAINKTGSSSLWTWLDDHRVPYLMNRYREDEARKLRDIVTLNDRPAETHSVPRGLNWDLWLGPAPYAPYHHYRISGSFAIHVNMSGRWLF